MLRCLMELGAKRSDLVQKFVPRSRVGVFRDERTRSTPLELKLMFWFVSYHLGPLGFLTKLGAKRSELVQKFVPRSRFGILRNERTRSTPLDLNLLFCCVSYHLDAFVTVRLPYETRCKTGRTSAKVRATKSSRIVFATNAPNPPYWTINSCFGAFCTVLVHLQPFGCLAKLGVKRFELVQKFVPRCRVRILRNRRTRSTPLDPKLLFCTIWVHLGPLSCLTNSGQNVPN